MKQNFRLIFIGALLSVVILSSCGSPATPNPTEVVAGIFTAAAQTVAAQQSLSTATLAASATPAPSATPTMIPTATRWGASPTARSQGYCDNSAYVADVTIKDGTVLNAGEEFDKTWTLKNTGTCTWSINYAITYVKDNELSGSKTTIKQTVAPLQTVNITVSMTAPTDAGDYTEYWRMINEQGVPFGEIVSVVISVSDSLTETVTPTVTAHVSISSTPSPTSPVAPSKTPTSPPAPTDTPVTPNTPEPTAVPTETPTATSGG